jgi:mono/diheme cytochrome c family protein
LIAGNGRSRTFDGDSNLHLWTFTGNVLIEVQPNLNAFLFLRPEPEKDSGRVNCSREFGMYVRTLALLAIAGLTASCATESTSTVSGQQLAQGMCAQCHVIGQRGADDEIRPRQAGSPPDFITVANEPATSPERLRQFLKLPHGAMNNVLLREEDIDKIVEFILDQKSS